MDHPNKKVTEKISYMTLCSKIEQVEINLKANVDNQNVYNIFKQIHLIFLAKTSNLITFIVIFSKNLGFLKKLLNKRISKS